MKSPLRPKKHVTLSRSLFGSPLPHLLRRLSLAARKLSLPATIGASACVVEACAPGTSTDDDAMMTPVEDDGDNIVLGMGGADSGIIDIDGDGIPDEPPENCGDGVLNDDEACDDGNKADGDGCASHCLALEPGFTCPQPGAACKPFAKCGDGVVSFPESCDDGNTDNQDGCSDNCKEEIGYRCDGSPSDCFETTCGDGKKEGSEACEHHPATLVDGQIVPGSGCNVDCQVEPDCSGFSCTSPCGDGLRINEECDDGNTLDGDGCSSTCTVEEGYTCDSAPCELYDPDGDGVGTCLLRVPAVFRDFNEGFSDMWWDGYNDCPSQHGMVDSQLVAGKPVYTGPSPQCAASAASFGKWYTESSPDNSTTVGELLLFDNGNGGFVNRYGMGGDGLTDTQYNGLDGNPSFFPLDSSEHALTDMRHPAAVPPQFYMGNWDTKTGSHNFHFTTEVLYWFTYEDDMDATLSFLGDDDVWVFLNGHLAVDLGGLHVPEAGSVTIRNGRVITDDFRNDAELSPDPGHETDKPASAYGLSDGNVYQIKVFQAERKVSGSSFQLTLAGFDSSRSDCKSNCGDGIIGVGEQCDDGVNDGGYNECQPGCVLGGYCGDGIVQEGEACDDGDPDKPAGCSGCRILLVK